MSKNDLNEDMKKVYDQFTDMYQKMAGVDPNYAKAFMAFAEAGTRDGALSRKTKELIAISLSVAQHCKYCIAYHVKAALELKATPAEIMEAAFVAGIQGV